MLCLWRVCTLTPARERLWRGRAGTGHTTRAPGAPAQRWKLDNGEFIKCEEHSRVAASTSTGPGRASMTSGSSLTPTAPEQTPALLTRLCSISGLRWVQRFRGNLWALLIGRRDQESLHQEWGRVETYWWSDWWLCGIVLYSYTELTAVTRSDWGGDNWQCAKSLHILLWTSPINFLKQRNKDM